MSSRILRKLDQTTLKSIANSSSRDEITGKSRKPYVDALNFDIQEAAAKYLVQNLKKPQLEAAVAILNIDHGDNNPNNKMVLCKRLRESLVDTGIKEWLNNCQDHSVVQQIGKALSIRGFSTMGIRVLKKTIEQELDIIGTQIVFNSLTLSTLKTCCEDLNIANYEHATSKNQLLQALTLGVDLPEPQKTRRRGTRKPKFAEIDDCETYDQLFQYYKVDELVSWCKDNGLKTSGAKRIVINRILAYHAGDKENTMADPTRVNRSKAKKEKPTKVTKKQDDEEMTDANEDESESESREQSEEVADENQVEESESVAMDLSGSDESEAPKPLENCTIAVYRSISTPTSELTALIERNGGTFFADKTISKAVTHIVCAEKHLGSDKIALLKKKGIKVVTEDFFQNLEA